MSGEPVPFAVQGRERLLRRFLQARSLSLRLVRQIGTGQAAPRLLIVDGQQRLTSLFAVMTGTEVLREDYSRARIWLAFRPADGTFEVTSAAIEWIDNIGISDRDPRPLAALREQYLAQAGAS